MSGVFLRAGTVVAVGVLDDVTEITISEDGNYVFGGGPVRILREPAVEERRFPIMPDVSHSVTSVRWEFVERYRERIEDRGGMTLERAAETGGMIARDLFIAVHKCEPGDAPSTEALAEWIERIAADDDGVNE